MRDFVSFKLQVLRERNLDLHQQPEEVRWVFDFGYFASQCMNLTYLTASVILSNDLHHLVSRMTSTLLIKNFR